MSSKYDIFKKSNTIISDSTNQSSSNPMQDYIDKLQTQEDRLNSSFLSPENHEQLIKQVYYDSTSAANHLLKQNNDDLQDKLDSITKKLEQEHQSRVQADKISTKIAIVSLIIAIMSIIVTLIA